MKKDKIIFCIAAISGMIVVLSSCEEKIKTQTLEVPVLREVSFIKDSSSKGIVAVVKPDVKSLEITVAKGKAMIEGVHTNLKFNNVPAEPLVCAIKQSQLDSLKNITLALPCTDACTDTILCLGITLGQVSNAVQIYFQTVIMCSNTGTFTENSQTKQNFKFCKAGKTYTVNTSGTFDEIDLPDETTAMNAAIALYKTKKSSSPYGVEVLDTAGVFRDFSADAGDGTGHTTDLVYPIDQLIAMTKPTGTVLMWNAVNAMKVEIAGKFYKIHKHDIIMSTSHVTYAGGQATTPGGSKFADLSNICPPNCSSTTYKFHVLPQ